MIERTVLMILKGIGYVLLIGIMLAVIVWACCGCGSSADIELPESPPKQYDGRFINAGSSGFFNVYIDTETGICYVSKADVDCPLTLLVDHEGKPFVANGWRDFDE